MKDKYGIIIQILTFIVLIFILINTCRAYEICENKIIKAGDVIKKIHCFPAAYMSTAEYAGGTNIYTRTNAVLKKDVWIRECCNKRVNIRRNKMITSCSSKFLRPVKKDCNTKNIKLQCFSEVSGKDYIYLHGYDLCKMKWLIRQRPGENYIDECYYCEPKQASQYDVKRNTTGKIKIVREI